jgi:hypothetical protein
MKKIIALFVLLISMSAQAAVVGAGELTWETFFENNNRVLKYSLNSVRSYNRSYRVDVWMFTEFKQPVSGTATTNYDGENVRVKKIFQHLIMNCDDNSYTQTEFFAFRWEDEANVGHLMTNETYGIKGGSPMEQLKGIVCNMSRMR